MDIVFAAFAAPTGCFVSSLSRINRSDISVVDKAYFTGGALEGPG